MLYYLGQGLGVDFEDMNQRHHFFGKQGHLYLERTNESKGPAQPCDTPLLTSINHDDKADI